MGCYLDTFLVVQCEWLLYCNVNNVSCNIVKKKKLVVKIQCYYCWRALARQHTILVNREKKSKILSDVRLEACAVEHYPGWLRRQSCANHMADI